MIGTSSARLLWGVALLLGCGGAPRASDPTPASAAGEAAGSAERAFAAGQAAGVSRLEPADIRDVVRANSEHVQHCYLVAARRAGSAPELRIDLTIYVAASGVVTSVEVHGPDLASLHDCVEAAVRAWRFPLAGEETRVGLPFVFRPTPPSRTDD